MIRMVKPVRPGGYVQGNDDFGDAPSNFRVMVNENSRTLEQWAHTSNNLYNTMEVIDPNTSSHERVDEQAQGAMERHAQIDAQRLANQEAFELSSTSPEITDRVHNDDTELSFEERRDFARERRDQERLEETVAEADNAEAAVARHEARQEAIEEYREGLDDDEVRSFAANQ